MIIFPSRRVVPTQTNGGICSDFTLSVRPKPPSAAPYSMDQLKLFPGRLYSSPALSGTKKVGRALVLSRDRRSTYVPVHPS